MAELDLTNIAAASIATPGPGVLAVYSELTSPAKRLSTKDDAGLVVNLIGQATTDQGANRLTNKDLDDATTFIVDNADTTKKLTFSTGGASTATVLTVAEAQTTSQTLNVPNIAGSSIIITDTLAQAITGVKTMTNMTAAAGTTAIPARTLTSGTNLTAAAAGAEEFDGVGMYNTVDVTNGRRLNDGWNLFRLAANGSGITTIADAFGANAGIPTVLNGVYEIEWDLYIAVSVAATGNITFTIVNTQTVTNMVASWRGSAIAGIAATGTVSEAGVITQTAASVALPATGTLAIANHHYVVRAIIEAATAGNVRLRLTQNVGGTATVQRGSFFKVRRLAAANVGTFVA